MTYTDILYEKSGGIATITMNRPQVRNAFRPLTVDEMIEAFNDAWEDDDIGVVILTGRGRQGVLQRRRPEGARQGRLPGRYRSHEAAHH